MFNKRGTDVVGICKEMGSAMAVIGGWYIGNNGQGGMNGFC